MVLDGGVGGGRLGVKLQSWLRSISQIDSDRQDDRDCEGSRKCEKEETKKKKRVQANDKHCVCVSAHEKEYAMIMKSADSISMETTV